MRRRIAVLVLAALVLVPAIPTVAAEPTTPPSSEPTPEPTASTEPNPTATPDPGATAEPSTSPAPSTSPGPRGTVDPNPVVDPVTPADPVTALSRMTGGVDPAGQYIVVLRSGSDTTTVVRHHRMHDGLEARDTFSRAFRGFSARLSTKQRTDLLSDPNVASIVPDELIQLTSQTIPTGVARIGARSSSIASIDGQDTRVDADVAIVDTGISLHPDLNVVGGYNCASSDHTAWSDQNGHGTHVAGTVAALDNNFGVVGVAPGARLWAVRILNADGYGLLSWYVCGLDWILAQRDPNDSSRPLIEAVNMSVAKDGADDVNCGQTNHDILHQAVCRLVAGGVTVVAAAANDSGLASKRVPAAYNEVITVSALADTDGKPGGLGPHKCYSWGGYDQDDTFADFSNYGGDVDLIAPGKCIWSTERGNSYGYMSGTSMAAPAVTGAVALYKSSRPNATPAEVKEALQYLGNLDWKTSTDPDSIHEKLLDVSKLGPLGTFDLDTSALGYTNSNGGTAHIPISIDRSATFFERVKFTIGNLPSGWTAALGSASVMGWTADSTTIAINVPGPVSAGTYHVQVIASNQGRTDSGTVNVVVENDKPTAKAPSGALTTGRLGTSTVPVLVSWPAGTDPTSGIGGYETQTSLNGTTWGGSASTAATVRSQVRSIAFAKTTHLRERVRDGAGNLSAWVESAGTVRPVVVDDRSSAVKYSSGWSSTANSIAYGKTLKSATKTGATATYTFTGRGIGVVFTKGSSRGSVAIYVDGVLIRDLSLRGSSASRQVLFTRSLTNGTHTIKIRSRARTLAQIDAFIVAR